MIQIEDLSFRYPGAEREAIRGLSLQIRPGSLFGLLGPNGSGKTTLISILTGLLPAVAGRLRIDGKRLPLQAREIQAFSALVPQDYAFYPRLSVIENLRFFGGVLAIPAAELRERIADALAVAGLESFQSARSEHLSGGLKRRLNLAIGLLNRPRLLFLDEPTVGIDPQSRHFILEAIKRINAEGTTVVYTSHYMEEVEMLCDEIGVLDDGRLLAHGTLEQLLDNAESRGLTITLATALNAQQTRVLGPIPQLEIENNLLRLAYCPETELQRLMALLAAEGISISRVKYGYGNLEELFLHLTGRQLRD
ncbi:MAG TPA: ABC transporter ATP-binding protein [Gammaproteobacteria bacterium]|nr:ABC transporter ATP-binding protein [Gammaproteobacteria bacterium]